MTVLTAELTDTEARLTPRINEGEGQLGQRIGKIEDRLDQHPDAFERQANVTAMPAERMN